MIRWGTLFLLIAALARDAVAESYARVCVTTVDAQSGEAPLTEKSVPISGEQLVVHLDANTECAALILPLEQKGSRLANGWRPQAISLPIWTEKILPVPPLSWEWGKAGAPFEIWVFFFKPDAIGLDEMQRLVTAMQNLKVSNQVLAQQTRRLCKMLSSRMSGDAPLSRGPKPNAALIGGTKRRIDFPWRDYAQKVLLTDALEGELVVRYGQ